MGETMRRVTRPTITASPGSRGKKEGGGGGGEGRRETVAASRHALSS